jgi:hypothetical protein
MTATPDAPPRSMRGALLRYGPATLLALIAGRHLAGVVADATTGDAPPALSAYSAAFLDAVDVDPDVRESVRQIALHTPDKMPGMLALSVQGQRSLASQLDALVLDHNAVSAELVRVGEARDAESAAKLAARAETEGVRAELAETRAVADERGLVIEDLVAVVNEQDAFARLALGERDALAREVDRLESNRSARDAVFASFQDLPDRKAGKAVKRAGPLLDRLDQQHVVDAGGGSVRVYEAADFRPGAASVAFGRGALGTLEPGVLLSGTSAR